MLNFPNKQTNPSSSALFPSNAFPAVVGTVHCEKCLAMLNQLTPGDVDLLEFRADAFLSDPGPALDQVQATGIPWIFTLRDFSQGGLCNLPADQKISILEEYSTGASWIDVELVSARSEPSLLASLRALSIPLILSHHDFETMPEATVLLRMRQEAADLGAGIFKVAAFASDSTGLHPLFRLLDTPPLPVSVMGMGPMGRASRLALAIAGSALNYGFLSEANAPGQWYAPGLKRAFLQSLGAERPA